MEWRITVVWSPYSTVPMASKSPFLTASPTFTAALPFFIKTEVIMPSLVATRLHGVLSKTVSGLSRSRTSRVIRLPSILIAAHDNSGSSTSSVGLRLSGSMSDILAPLFMPIFSADFIIVSASVFSFPLISTDQTYFGIIIKKAINIARPTISPFRCLYRL